MLDVFDRFKNFSTLTNLDVLQAMGPLDGRDLVSNWFREQHTYNMSPTRKGQIPGAGKNSIVTIDLSKNASSQSSDCQILCLNAPKCIAWSFETKKKLCHISDWFKPGEARENVMSGINPIELTKWVRECRNWSPIDF